MRSVIAALLENGILQLQTSIVCIMPFNLYQSWFIGQWSIDHVLKVKLRLLNVSFSKAETIDGFENMSLRAFYTYCSKQLRLC